MPRRISVSLIISCLCVALSVNLTGCERYIYGKDPYGQRKDIAKTRKETQSAATPRPVAITGKSEVRVRRGETLFGISRKYNVPLRDLIEVNGLKPPYTLLTGSRIFLPRNRIHVVVAGDTLYGISRRHSVDMSLLAHINQLDPPEIIRVGQRLRLPATITSLPSVAGKTAPSLFKGKTGSYSTPAKKRGVSRGVPKEPTSYMSPPPLTSSRFHRPLRGKIVGVYGPSEEGLHNDGINILTIKGAPVEATENGVVVYAGNELQGFGNLLLIKHAEGWTSAYAHNDSVLVKRGQKVKRGQVVARAGSTGNVSKPQLHFELRRGTRAVDPTMYL